MTKAKIGNIESFEKRIKELKEKHRSEQLKHASDYIKIASGKITVAEAKKHWHETPEQYRQWCLDRADDCKRYADKFSLSMHWMSRRKYFRNYKDSCGFNPLTGDGHSYKWYALTKVIKGKLVLNTYRYSNCTSKHIDMMAGLFRELGLKYTTVEAPQGLQNLEQAIEYKVNLIEGLAEQIKKPRTRKETNLRRLAEIKRYRADIEQLQSLAA